MISYKGRTWCIHSLNDVCQNTECYRFYTKEEQDYNKNDLPLSVADCKTEECRFIPTWNYKE